MTPVTTLDDLTKIIEKTTVLDIEIKLIGDITELDFLEFLRTKQISYQRAGFKRWRITAKMPSSQNSILIRKCLLIICCALLLIILFYLIYIGFWAKIEKAYGEHQLLIAIVVPVITLAIGKILTNLFKATLHTYFYG